MSRTGHHSVTTGVSGMKKSYLLRRCSLQSQNTDALPLISRHNYLIFPQPKPFLFLSPPSYVTYVFKDTDCKCSTVFHIFGASEFTSNILYFNEHSYDNDVFSVTLIHAYIVVQEEIVLEHPLKSK